MSGDPAPSPATSSTSEVPEGTRAPMGPGVLASAQALLGDLRVAFQERVQLLSLELRQAGLALTQMIMFAVVVALLIVSAWLALMVGLFMASTAFGLHWSLAIGVVFAVNAGGAVGLWLKVRQLTMQLMLPATVRTIRASMPVSAATAAPAVASNEPVMTPVPPVPVKEAEHG